MKRENRRNKPKDFKGTLKRLLKYLRPQLVRIALIVVAAIFSTVFMVLSPMVLGEAITSLYEDVKPSLQGGGEIIINFTALAKILGVLIGTYALSAIFSYMQQMLLASLSQNTVYDMRRDINDKFTKIPFSYFDATAHGEILSRVTNDIDTISRTLQQSVSQLITAVLTIVGVFAMMLFISPTLTLITIVTLPLAILITKSAAKRSQKFFMLKQRTLGDINGHIEEMYTGHQIIKAFGYEKKSIERFDKINDELFEYNWKAQFISGIIMPLMNFVNNIGYVLVSVVGGIFVINGMITIGNIQAFIQYARQFTQPIVQISNIINIIQETIAAAERVFEVLDEDEEIPDTEQPIAIENIKGHIEFKNVDFGYKKDEPLIKNMSMEAKKGQTIAIVGPSGAGKTTLVNLLMRFYEIDNGEILIDGVNITDLKKPTLRTMFGMVLQDTWLFNGTIEENIAYANDDASKADVIRAAEAAHADAFIRTLPDGYDTVLNEEASNVSQGQKQLITIARAILSDPRMLILDEATSNIDTRTEVYIQKAMDNLMENKTSFVIAHRLSTIKNADLILVLVDGEVVEKGTHDELIDRGDFYADLYNSQFLGLDAG